MSGGDTELPDADVVGPAQENDAAVENGGSAVRNGAGEADPAGSAKAEAAERTEPMEVERPAEPMEPVRGMAVRGEVRHVAEDRGHMHVQVTIAGRKFKGMVREVPAPTVVLNDKESAEERTQPSIVVVGAGIAGLAAADELHALGCKEHAFCRETDEVYALGCKVTIEP
ncbi:hypothetical protein T484DRAFT_1763157 [Baffinella frigidus]|nr:hypothetical protein T484DRAFT_1763157 [Cryptophyta sp. CCMP2293]